VLIPVLTSSNPGNIEVTLQAPTKYTSVVAMSSFYNLNGCGTMNGIPVYDNNTVTWGSGSTSSVCSATAYTGFATGYDNSTGAFHCFSGTSCSSTKTTGTYITDPFAQTFQMGAGTASGTWTLGFYASSNGYSVTSWALQFYRMS